MVQSMLIAINKCTIVLSSVLLAALTATGCSRSGGTAENRTDPGAAQKSQHQEALPPPPELGRSMPGTPGPSRPQPVLWLEPGDLLTSTGPTPIRAWLDNQGDPVSEALLAEVANELQLSAYPSLEPIAFDVVTQNVTPVAVAPNSANKQASDEQARAIPSTPSSGDRAYIEVQPKGSLASSWYIFSLKSIPTGVRVAPWSAPNPPVGGYAVRFHTGSQPVLVRALFCEKAPGHHRAILEFSENLKASGDFETLVSVEQPATKTKCVHGTSGPVPAASMRWIDQDCHGASKSDPWRLSIRPGLESANGTPLRRFAGEMSVDELFDIAALPDGDHGCKVLRF